MSKKNAPALTAQSEVGTLRHVLLRDPRVAFASKERIDSEWRALDYLEPPDLRGAIEEFDRFAAALEDAGARLTHDPAPGLTLDSIYVRDAALPTDGGVVLCSMAKQARRAEPEALRPALEAENLPVLGEITGAGTLEGGDAMWLDDGVLAVGRGYRTNDEGIRQLGELVGELVAELVVVPLPHWRGPDDVFHLMSIASPLAERTLLVYPPLLPASFHQWLSEHDYRLIAVPDDEFESMACNVLALAPGRCLMLDGNPRTRRRLERAGIDISTYAGAEISRKGQGGPTCLTRPLLRQQ